MQLIRLLRTFLKNPKLLATKEYWTIGVIKRTKSPLETFQSLQSEDIVWLQPKDKWNFIADPFLTSYFGEELIFFERMEYSKRKGNISYIKVSDAIQHPNDFEKYSHVALDLPTHLSYPCLFQYENELYMIPENSACGNIDLYQCSGTPDSWTKVRTLFEGFMGIDNTIFYYNNLWWLFSTKKIPGTRNEDAELFIWFAENPLQEWKKHPASPIIYQNMGARGAGLPFIENDVLYRPSQDCSEGYGKKIYLNRVVQLFPESFVETPESIMSGVFPHNYALHTYHTSKDTVVVDGKGRCYGVKNIIRILGSILI